MVYGIRNTEYELSLYPIPYTQYLLFAEIKILEVIDSRCIDDLVLVTRGQLLENIHISKLDIAHFARLVRKSYEKPVLIKIIIRDFFPKVDMQLIV